ncbi:MAG TPA: hypothetical protein PLD12_09615, partial [Bacteroidales bacterium]|nr:hypothetical protein [Bacteroidales bacterium]
MWSSEWSKRQVWPQGRLSFQSVGRRKTLSGKLQLFRIVEATKMSRPTIWLTLPAILRFDQSG